MEQYTVTGMSCAACSARVENAVSKVEGVTSCSVSLLTNSMGVEGQVTPDAIIKAVEDAGYGAALKTAKKSDEASAPDAAEDMLKDRDTPVLKKRLLASVGFLVVLMYFSMGHMMWGWPLPAFFTDNHVAMGLVQMLLTIIIMVINQKFFISGFKGLIHRAPNMDTLVALGAGAAFLYSTYALFAMTDAQVKGDMAGVMSYMHEFYFESAAMILTLITVGKMLEARSKGKTTDALKGLMKLAPVGVFCLIARTFAGLGLDAFLPLLKYMLAVFLALALQGLVVYQVLLKLFTGLSPVRFLKKFAPVMAFAFSTATSNATIPLSIDTLHRKMGVSKKISSFTIPLGATINMDGTAIMQGVAVVFAAQAFHIQLSAADFLTVIATATLASIGTAGVPSVGLITLSMVFNSVGLPVEAIGLIMGIDRILDMTRTAVNITGDAVCTTIVARQDNAVDVEIFNKMV